MRTTLARLLIAAARRLARDSEIKVLPRYPIDLRQCARGERLSGVYFPHVGWNEWDDDAGCWRLARPAPAATVLDVPFVRPGDPVNDLAAIAEAAGRPLAQRKVPCPDCPFRSSTGHRHLLEREI